MIKEFTYVTGNGNAIKVNLAQVTSSILWCYRGLYGLIPFAKIQNAREHWKDLHTSANDDIPTACFYWHDVIPVSPQIANALLGEDKDDKCTYRGKDSPNTGPASG